jgi:ribonuclease HI
MKRIYNINLMNIFIDGSVINNGFPNAKGGIGVYCEHTNYQFMEEFTIKPITNQRCELMACYKAMEYILSIVNTESSNNYKGCIWNIYTDSNYVYKILTNWIYAWQKNNWLTAGKTPVKNQEIIKNLWKIYQILITEYDIKIKFYHIYSHLKKPENINSAEYNLWKGNDIVDKLAKKSY